MGFILGDILFRFPTLFSDMAEWSEVVGGHQICRDSSVVLAINNTENFASNS